MMKTPSQLGIINDNIPCKSAHKIWPLFELVVKIRRVLIWPCLQNAHAQILKKISCETLRKNAHPMNVSGNMHFHFADFLLKLTHVTITIILLERHPQR